ncbi:major tail protein [Arthrobacter phage Uzumaki]|nr:major tail protein [Arthrobacter phage Uzumaki]
MVALTWDDTGKRFYETGVEKGVLYKQNATGVYDTGFAWNGLSSVTESPSGAEANAVYADNIKYLNLISNEDFSGTIEAYTYPAEFAECDGTATLTPGLYAGQQNRKTFGLSYKTLLGNDVLNTGLGYKLHLVYGATAAPTERAYASVNESPEALTFSWEFSTNPVPVPGFKPSAILTIDSTKVNASKMADLELALYGSAGVEPRLPLPAEVLSILSQTLTVATPTAPTYNAATDTITIPAITGVDYFIDGVKKTGAVVITKDTVVTASPQAGYKFPAVTDDDWLIVYS